MEIQKFNSFIVTFLVVTLYDVNSYKLVPRIMNGHYSEGPMYPFMAMITTPEGEDYVALCGASVMTNRWMVTAAHCLCDDEGNPKPDNSVSAYLGSNHTYEGELYKSIKIVIHEAYVPRGGHDNDIAMFKTEKTIADKYTPIPVPQNDEKNDFGGTIVYVRGWGLTNENTTSDLLRECTVKLVKPQDCTAVTVGHLNPEGKLCALIKDSHECVTAEGDSGSPVTTKDDNGNYIQIGLVSEGINTNTNRIVIRYKNTVIVNDIYTNVQYYKLWMNTVMETN